MIRRRRIRMVKIVVAILAIPGALVLAPIVMEPIDTWLKQIKANQIKVPSAHDARLIGTWKGSWKFLDDPENQSRTTNLRADGTGDWSVFGHRPRPFTWGTENGLFYTKFMATDAWAGWSHQYRLSTDQKKVSFSQTKTFDVVCEYMQRQ